jgi:hypothetical protein
MAVTGRSYFGIMEDSATDLRDCLQPRSFLQITKEADMKEQKKDVVTTWVLLVAIILTLAASMLYAHFGLPWGRDCSSAEERAAWIGLAKRFQLSDDQLQDLEACH